MNGFEELTLELKDWCPSKCLHCSSESGPNCTNTLDEELALRLVDEAAHLRAAKVSLGGGEPTASKGFFPIVQRVRELGMLVEVFTCGLAVSAHGVSSLPSAITESCAGLKGVKFIFSCHGATAQTHDYITRTPGSYECLLSSLKCCQQVGIECEFNFVPLRVNIHEFDKLISIAQGLQIPRISVLRFVPQGRGAVNRAELELNPEEEGSFVSEVVRLRETASVEIRTGSPYNGIISGNQVPCRAGFGKLVVQADGNVLPCEVFKHHERRQWDLSVHDMTLTQIVESPQVSNLHQRLQIVDCLECPVHRADRNIQKAEGYRAVSKTVVHAK